MPNTKAPSISPTVICANGDFSKLKTMISEQINLKNATKIFVPIGPLAIRNAISGKLSQNQQIARIQKIVQIASEKGLKISSAYDSKHARKGQMQMNQKPKGSQRTNFEIEHSMAINGYGPGNSGNKALELLLAKKLYFTKLAAVDGGLRQIIASRPDEKTLVITKPYFAAYVMEALRIPTKNYHGVSPYGGIPPMPNEIVQAKKYLEIASIKKRPPVQKIKSKPLQKPIKKISKRTIPINRRTGKR